MCCRSESPSSQRSSPPISPGCEDQMLDAHEPFKKPLPPMRPQEFPPFYSGYPYHLIQHGSSAFHRPIDASGKPLPVSAHAKAIFLFCRLARHTCAHFAHYTSVYLMQITLSIRFIYMPPQNVLHILIRNARMLPMISMSSRLVATFVCN